MLGACGDPLVVTGDPPGLMRLALGVPLVTNGSLAGDALTSVVKEPAAVALTATGLLYAADQGRRARVTAGGNLTDVARIVAVTSAGQLDVVLDGDGCPGSTCVQRIRAMTLDGSGRIVLSDDMGRRVWRLDPGTGGVTLIAGDGSFGTAPDGAVATGAPLADPVGVAVGSDGTVYIAEHTGNRVVAVGTDGILRVVAGTGEAAFGGDGGAATAARLHGPTGLALGGGTLYVADEGNHRIRAVDLGPGTIRTVAGSGEPGGTDGPAAAARLRSPWALALAPDGRTLYVAERNAHRIRSVDLDAATVGTFAGTGQPVYTGAGRPAGDTGLNRPSGLATALDFLFVADAGNAVVWRTRIRF
jgi:sugar lactone lactonase YvrE